MGFFLTKEVPNVNPNKILRRFWNLKKKSKIIMKNNISKGGETEGLVNVFPCQQYKIIVVQYF